MNSQHRPPKLALRFLRWYCHPDYLEDIEGDLLERFEIRVASKGMTKARWGFTLDVIRLFRPGIIRPWEGYQQLNHYGMFRNYFKITCRNLLKQKLYAFINIGGLAVGLTCFILIILYIQHELSYDRFFDNSDRIHRVYQRQLGNAYLGSDYFSVTPARLATTLTAEFPTVTHATSVNIQTALLEYEGSHFWEYGFLADTSFFDIFSYSFLAGNPGRALKEPRSIVLTRSLAQKIFGTQDPMGRVLNFQNNRPLGNTTLNAIPYKITGVLEDPPTNGSFQFSYVIDIQSNAYYRDRMEKKSWNSNSFFTFFLLAEGAELAELQEQMPGLLDKYKEGSKEEYLLQPLTDIHLQPGINFDVGLKGNLKYVYLSFFIALIIVLLACVNYMNLAIARSIKRSREVGLRKVVGAVRRQLVFQFLLESVLITFLALCFAVGLTYFLLPFFGDLVERPLELPLAENISWAPGLLALVIIVGILAGSYPAFFMSALRPIHILKGTQDKFAGFKIQRWLIVGQYTLSIVLVISSVIIYRQFQFIQQKELGYDKDHIITVKLRDPSLMKKIEVIREELLSDPRFDGVTASMHLPTNITSNTEINDERDKSEGGDLLIYESEIDYEFLDVFDIKLLAGRNFSPGIKTDNEEGYILNETAARALGWSPTEAIGKQFTHDGVETIIGVVEDFHMHSMHHAIQPLMMHLTGDYSPYLSVKVKPGDLVSAINTLEQTFKSHSPFPFEYQFLEDEFDQLYKAEIRLGQAFTYFTALSLLIASLGLFGLAAFTASQRTKEIGIRKVLGASVRDIVSILSQDFVKMVTLGFFLAIPIAWYTMHNWLQNFAYHIALEWWIFVLAGFAAIIIALVTISSQSIKAALTNPVDSLRNE
ncbi:MAG: ABC transporter permease [Cytophagales bacterium]|nr:ABC transporter permease [Cytophagales bacterium]